MDQEVEQNIVNDTIMDESEMKNVSEINGEIEMDVSNTVDNNERIKTEEANNITESIVEEEIVKETKPNENNIEELNVVIITEQDKADDETNGMTEFDLNKEVQNETESNGGNAEQQPETSSTEKEIKTDVDEDEEIDVVGLSDHDSVIQKDNFSELVQEDHELDETNKRGRKRKFEKPKSRSISPVPEFTPIPDDPYDYDGDEHYFDNKEIELPFENMEKYTECFKLMPPGEKRYVLDHMLHAANVMFGEYRRLNGHLRALNARSGRINKQVQREAEVVASGSDPRLAPRSSKNLNTSVVDAVIHLDENEAERILSKKKITPTMRALLRTRRDDLRLSTGSGIQSENGTDVKIKMDQ